MGMSDFYGTGSESEAIDVIHYALATALIS